MEHYIRILSSRSHSAFIQLHADMCGNNFNVFFYFYHFLLMMMMEKVLCLRFRWPGIDVAHRPADWKDCEIRTSQAPNHPSHVPWLRRCHLRHNFDQEPVRGVRAQHAHRAHQHGGVWVVALVLLGRGLVEQAREGALGPYLYRECGWSLVPTCLQLDAAVHWRQDAFLVDCRDRCCLRLLVRACRTPQQWRRWR